MLEHAHGEFTIRWCAELCMVSLRGGFNRAGAQQLADAVMASWQAAGSPARWAHIVDLRQWDGGTPDSFEPARALAAWTMAHGVCVIIRLRHNSFITRVVDSQHTLEASSVPVLDFTDPDAAWQALQARGLACEDCRPVFDQV